MNSTLTMRQPGLIITKSQMNQSNYFDLIVHGHYYGERIKKSSQQQVKLEPHYSTHGSTCFSSLCLPGLPSDIRPVTHLLPSSSISLQFFLFQTRQNTPSPSLRSALVRIGADWSISQSGIRLRESSRKYEFSDKTQ